MRDIRRLLKIYVTRLETKDAVARATKEWRIVARVIDRLFFFCYIGTIIMSMMTVFGPVTIFAGDHTPSINLPDDQTTTAASVDD